MCAFKLCPLRRAFREAIVSLLLFMGKPAILGLMAVLSYLAFGAFEEQGRVLWQRELNYYLLPMIVSPSTLSLFLAIQQT